MSVKDLFEGQFEQQKREIALRALKQSWQGGIQGKQLMGDVIDDIQSNEVLWQTFRGLTFQEVRSWLAGPREARTAVVAGPSRRRGVTSGRIVDYERANPGVRRSDIMTALKLKGGTVSSQLRTLRISGKLRAEGEERNLQYYSVD